MPICFQGKTVQSLAFLDGMFNYGIRGPFLVIAPLSTIPNWQREFELWSNMNVIVYHGSQTSRNMLAEYEMYYKVKYWCISAKSCFKKKSYFNCIYRSIVVVAQKVFGLVSNHA